MARLPEAAWRPVPNCNLGQMMHPVRGLVLHIMQGTLDGTDAEFHNPATQKSAHFGTGRDGRLYQWVDTNDKAWAIVNGNRFWISIENEGFSGNTLTGSQIERCANVLAWLHRLAGVALQIADSPDGHGLGWHGMGGNAWGGHPQCPGAPILDQRPQIIDLARRAVQELMPDLPSEDPAHCVF